MGRERRVKHGVEKTYWERHGQVRVEVIRHTICEMDFWIREQLHCRPLLAETVVAEDVGGPKKRLASRLVEMEKITT
jgi:hypothetical protein